MEPKNVCPEEQPKRFAGPAEDFAEAIITHHVEKVLYARLMDVMDLALGDDGKRKMAAKRMTQTALRSLVDDMRHLAPVYQKGWFMTPVLAIQDSATLALAERLSLFSSVTGEAVFPVDAAGNSIGITAQTGADKSGLLKVGQTWQHTTGTRMTILAVNVHTYKGVTNLAENPDTGTITAISGLKEDFVNWTLIE